ncbi:amidase [Starkeya koreensis]|uniref:Amidase n=1 Tax=Ancylobacter koreensis TaxID=266121 RepID=A0ABT0DJQ9_9HYPH|nr:amidase [Ancylobacter koreensis]MCK0207513.1 amidase [Ancylobacter koreensis]
MNMQLRDDPARLTASEARRRIDGGALTATRLVAACLERIERREPDVLAWEHVDAKGALETAARLDAGPTTGLLHGIPFGVKDILDTFDQPSTYGSPIYRGHRPPWDAATVALARAQGGIALGKTVTTEFANRHAGKTRNPLDPAHTPGGSSSGSAAAVADFHVPLAIGTQTGGSVVRPAAYCGVYGYKPSFRLLSNTGVRTNTEQFDTVGLMARSVEDVALFKAAVGELPFVPVAPDEVSAPRIGICCTPHWDQTEPATRDALDAAVRALEAAGARVVNVSLPAFFDALDRAHKLICGFESLRNYADELTRWPDQVSEDFKRERVEVGTAASLAEFRDALRLGERARRWMDAMIAEQALDALLTPSAAGEAPEGLASTGQATFNYLWTHLHMPAVTLPHFTGPRGLPVGIQLVGPRYADDRHLSLVAWADRVLAAS